MADAERVRVAFCRRCGRDYPWKLLSCPHCASREDTESIPAGVRTWYAPVAGTGADNLDGTSRQKILAEVRGGDRVVFEHETGNVRNPHAVRVLLARGRRQIGYLPREQAEEVLQREAEGHSHYAAVVDATGGTASRPARGALLFVLCAAPRESMAEVEHYFEQRLAREV